MSALNHRCSLTCCRPPLDICTQTQDTNPGQIPLPCFPYRDTSAWLFGVMVHTEHRANILMPENSHVGAFPSQVKQQTSDCKSECRAFLFGLRTGCPATFSWPEVSPIPLVKLAGAGFGTHFNFVSWSGLRG